MNNTKNYTFQKTIEETHTVDFRLLYRIIKDEKPELETPYEISIDFADNTVHYLKKLWNIDITKDFNEWYKKADDIFYDFLGWMANMEPEKNKKDTDMETSNNKQERPHISARDYLAESYPEAIIMDGFDDAIIGIDTNERVVYDYEKMIKVLVERDDMDDEEAAEFIDYNSIRSLPYAGPNGPIIIYPIETEF